MNENKVLILELLNDINNTNLSLNIDNLYTNNDVINNIIKKKPVHISLYSHKLFEIKTKDSCKFCTRNAMYLHNETQYKYCWIHSQNIELLK